MLIAALLELKSRLMLPREEDELLDVEPVEAAEELLARMIEAKRYRSAAEHLRELLEAEEGVRYRAAPLPAWLRADRAGGAAEGVYAARAARRRARRAAAPSAEGRRHPPGPGPRSASPSGCASCASLLQARARRRSTRRSRAPTA